MCHLLLLSPVFGLLIFWLMPIWIAVPVYVVILLLSILLYVITIRVMRLPKICGIDALLQRPGLVIGVTNRGYHVRIAGESWQAVSVHRLQVGDQVRVVMHHGITLEVERLDSRAAGCEQIAT